MQEIQEMLDRLAHLRRERAQLSENQQAAIDRVIPDEVGQQIEMLNGAFEEDREKLAAEIGGLETEIKNQVKQLGQTVNGSSLQAIFGIRISWDTGKLDGVAAVFPDILDFRKETPYASIRERKTK